MNLLKVNDYHVSWNPIKTLILCYHCFTSANFYDIFSFLFLRLLLSFSNIKQVLIDKCHTLRENSIWTKENLY